MKKFISFISVVIPFILLAGCAGNAVSSTPTASTAPSTPTATAPSTPTATAPSAPTPENTTEYVILEEDLGSEEYSVAFRKDDISLASAVQDMLDDMVADGTTKKISEKWFGEDIYYRDGEAYSDLSNIDPNDTSLADVCDAKKIILGLDENFPPMGFRDENGNIVGFDIDLAQEVANRIGVELILQPIDWSAKELELNSGKIDMIWNGMTVTDERVENMCIIKPYVSNRQVIIVGAQSEINSKSDLKGKKIGLQAGSSSVEALNADPISKEVGSVNEYPENLSAFLDLKAGRIDAFVVDIVAGAYIIENNK